MDKQSYDEISETMWWRWHEKQNYIVVLNGCNPKWVKKDILQFIHDMTDIGIKGDLITDW